jgi:hypothetical protein
MLPKHILDVQTFVANLPILKPRDFCIASRGAEAFQAPIADGRIAINETVPAGVREDIECKFALHAADFVRSLPDL